MAKDYAVGIHVHPRDALRFGASPRGDTVWMICPDFHIDIQKIAGSESTLTIFLGDIVGAKVLADAIYDHCRKQAAAYQEKAEAMAAAGEDAPNGT
ncbi:MAG TPA: hypothetical protein VM537_12265 [Anaerolineae bacterium]|nr:hypothetical protein [Anaerolineae bacterium]